MKRSTFILVCMSALALSLVCSRVPGCATLHALMRQEGEASFVSGVDTNAWHAQEIAE